MAGFVGRRRGLVATMALLAFALPVAAAEPETEPATAATPGDPPSDASTSWGTQAPPPQGTQAQPPQGTQAQPPPAQELATSKDLQRLQESLAALRAQLEVARVDGIAQAREHDDYLEEHDSPETQKQRDYIKDWGTGGDTPEDLL